MGYDVMLTEVDLVGQAILSDVSLLSDQLDQVTQSIETLNALSSFQGSGADSAKSYFQEVHGCVILGIAQAIAELSTRYCVYMDGYPPIEGDKDGRLPQDGIVELSTNTGTFHTTFNPIDSNIQSIISSVAHLVSLMTPNASTITDALTQMKDDADALDPQVEGWEAAHACNAQNVAELISTTSTLMAQCSAFSPTPGGYTSGAIGSTAVFQKYYQEIEASNQYVQQQSSVTNSAIDHLNTRMNERIEERRQKGELEVIKGIADIGLIVLGGIATVMTGGAAAPVLIACIAMGTFKASHIVEGINDINLANQGDISTPAFNFLRDTIFQGDQDAYNLAEKITDYAGAAVQAGSVAFNSARAAVPVAESMGVSASTVYKNAAMNFAKNQLLSSGKKFVTDMVKQNVVHPLVNAAWGDNTYAAGLTNIVLDTAWGAKGSISKIGSTIQAQRTAAANNYSQNVESAIKSECGDHFAKNVTIQTQGDTAARIRASYVGYDKDGNTIVYVTKNSYGASFSNNQQNGYNNLAAGGGEIRGNNAASLGTGYTSGSHLGAGDVTIRIIEPSPSNSNEASVFNIPLGGK